MTLTLSFLEALQAAFLDGVAMIRPFEKKALFLGVLSPILRRCRSEQKREFWTRS